MLNLSDIVQLVLLSAVIFFTLGYVARHYIPRWLQYWKNRLLSPSYLKAGDIGMRDASSSKNIKK
ncbi:MULTISPECIES: cellulose biosynthesis protein BcsF [unclassified Brenneria]|uniref:cellulose biosynthesis protein BcsF n=1 Tax=unclassified Brenneria TaxID=2634434 RepID=UPI0029C29DFC|nr:MULTISPECIES: cellulose biosynthesis protein BcsF [unclassified Brenneria]MDX5629974.1 cellulose biosynthesis protein BcsF [Brenneria sp. L3-3Z]MDX5697120.1 cellulose biosynthesis protein BcsF [Brenneria sp. L4-2C]MEE3664623.1 cellulose biosynthesis protein BcsF [Brenneria sp. g21c3]